MMATIRNRRAVISRVKPVDTHQGRLHLVELEYTDVDSGRADDTVIWEREVGATLHEPNALPDVLAEPPMAHAHFDALLRASRWSALTPSLTGHDSPEGADMPLASPLHGAVEVEDFQLVPLLKALEMPRISLLLADDVGLGKTIEAGLILTELLLRRRIRRVLIMAPASLRDQWQQEMHDKFSLGFDVVDRQETYALQKRLGLDANPWRTFPRIITSYHFLRQHDVLQQFLATCKPGTQRNDAAQLPWDLLIVDEAHNLMPSPFGQDSDLVDMLRAVSPLFEHKLFLTATPHNGHTRSFSGLLELLDPVRFSRTPHFTEAEKGRLHQVVVRRLKSEINELDDEHNRPRRFAERFPEPLPLYFGTRERALADRFAAFRTALKSEVARARRSEQTAGAFAIEVLQKRLLSSPRTLADSWYRFLDGVRDDESASQLELFAARRAEQADIADDLEKEDRGRHVSRTAGAWLKPLAGALMHEIEQVTHALQALGLEPASRQDGEAGETEAATPGQAPGHVSSPTEDARFARLLELIDKRLRLPRRKGRAGGWVDGERLIVFTEYKTTLDDLEARLRVHYDDSGSAIRVLYGGMDQSRRQAIKTAFNDPADAIRVLIATDTASEGLNLQETARLLLHYDIPWNPSRIEQRNGRLDRHGQARDVTAYHFTSDDDADLRFLGRVVTKVHQIREDLGTLGEIFDAAFQRRFGDLEDGDRVAAALEQVVDEQRTRHAVPSTPVSPDSASEERVRRLCRRIDLSPETLRSTLEVALGLDIGYPRLTGPDGRGRFQLAAPIPPRWSGLVDDSLRLPALGNALPGLIFDAARLLVDIGGRRVFRPSKDSVLLHLGHPMFRHALATFARLRFPGHQARVPASRWTVRRAPVPRGADALLVLAVEELAVNALREPFHHWVRVLHVPIEGDELGEPEPPEPDVGDSGDTGPAAASGSRPRTAPAPSAGEDDMDHARELWEMVFVDVEDLIRAHARTLEADIAKQLHSSRDRAIADAGAAFTSRIAEVHALIKRTAVKELERELDEVEQRLAQGFLFADMQREVMQRRREINEEIERRKNHSGRMLEHLADERTRVVERLVPLRYSLSGGGVQVFPLAVEIRLPEVRR